jgi:hypothetical protein
VKSNKSTMKGHPTREAWLNEAVEAHRSLFKAVGVDLPERIQCAFGFPKAKGRQEPEGQCWDKAATKDGTYHILVSPTQSEPLEILAILGHELCHAALPLGTGHKKPFSDLAKKMGLEGKPTSCRATEGSPLWAKLETMAKELGPLPHSAIVKLHTGPKRAPAGGWIKLVSKTDEDYILRISPKAAKEHGFPSDPWGDMMVEAE